METRYNPLNKIDRLNEFCEQFNLVNQLGTFWIDPTINDEGENVYRLLADKNSDMYLWGEVKTKRDICALIDTVLACYLIKVEMDNAR